MDKTIHKGTVAKVRSAGFFTKGLVYILIGLLTFIAVFSSKGEITSTDGLVEFLIKLPLGKLLGALIALGLIAYSLWRLYQVLKLPNQAQTGDKKISNSFKRFRFFYSAVFYGFIAYSFARPLIKQFQGQSAEAKASSGEAREKAALWELLSTDWGETLLWILAAIIAAQAFWQFKISYTAQFLKKIDNYPDIRHEYDFIKKSGRMGYAARGLVFGIISFFLVKVILEHNANIYKGTEDALQYLLSFSYGSILLAATSAGLIGYGIFNMMVARHANLTTLQ